MKLARNCMRHIKLYLIQERIADIFPPDLYGEIEQHIHSCSFGKFKQYIEKIDFENYAMDKTYFNNNKVSDHHALIPTINAEIDEIYNNKLSEMELQFL